MLVVSERTEFPTSVFDIEKVSVCVCVREREKVSVKS